MKTKTKLLICGFAAAFMLSGYHGFSQDMPVKKANSDWTIGAFGGSNLSQLVLGSKEINQNYQFSFGYNAGLMVSYQFHKYLSLVAEPTFMDISSESKGIQALLPTSPYYVAENQRYANYTRKERFSYIELPVMVRVTAGDRIKYYANAGPFVGVNLDARMETTGSSLLFLDKNGQTPEPLNGSSHSMDQSYNNTSNTETFNFGFTAGVGTGYTMGRHGIWLDARYNIGLLNIRSYSSVNGENNLHSLLLSLGYTYNLPE